MALWLRAQHLRGHRQAIRGWRTPQCVVDKDHNIWEFTERQFGSFGHHSSLRPKTATFESSQRGNSCPSTITVHCGQRQQHLRVHREAIHVLHPPQLIVAKDSSIWEFTERIFVSFGHHSSLWPKTATFESSHELWYPTATNSLSVTFKKL